MPPFVKPTDNPLAEEEGKEEEEEDPFRDPSKESVVMLCNVGQAVMGFVVCIVGAAYSHFYKWAFILLGLLMLGAGMGGAVATTKRSWTILFIVNCVHGFTTIVLLILLIMAGLMAFDIRDPVTEAVEATWFDIRPDLETSDFCTSVPEEQRHCQEYQDWAAVATEPVTDNSTIGCPWTMVEMAQNCSRTADCATSAAGPPGSECHICDTECKNVLLDQLRGNVSAISMFFYVVFWASVGVLIFNIRLADISSDVDDWNEFMRQEAKKRGVDEYNEEDMSGTMLHKLGVVVNLCVVVVGLLCSIVAAVILSSYSAYFQGPAWGILVIGLGLSVTGGALFYGAKTTTTSVLKIGNYLFALHMALFLFFSVLLSMTTGDVSDLHQSVEDEWPNTQIKVQRDDPAYCKFPSADCIASEDPNGCEMTTEECRAKFMDEVKDNVENVFTLVFLEMGFLVVLVLLTNGVVIAMYHGDGGNLKDKVRGMTNHSKRLPEAERTKMLYKKTRPVMMSAAQQEAAVLGDADPEDPLEKDPEDPEAVKYLRKADACLHDGDMDEAVKFYVKAQSVEPGNEKLKHRVRNARRQLAINIEMKHEIDMYDSSQVQQDDAAMKIQAIARGRKTRQEAAEQEEAAKKVQAVARGRRARKKE